MPEGASVDKTSDRKQIDALDGAGCLEVASFSIREGDVCLVIRSNGSVDLLLPEDIETPHALLGIGLAKCCRNKEWVQKIVQRVRDG